MERFFSEITSFIWWIRWSNNLLFLDYVIQFNVLVSILVFGFVFFDYIGIIIAMIIGAVAGSWAGTQLRNVIEGKKFLLVLKIFLSALAIHVMVKVFI